MRLDVPMTEQVATQTRPAGTSALIYGVIAVATSAVATPVLAVLHVAPICVLVAALTGVAGVVALVVGFVKRLAGGERPRPRAGRIALVATAPALVAVVLGVALLIARR